MTSHNEVKVRTRVAPSPTGFPHLGLVYQAMFDYVLAHKYNGSFILRIEDTDQARFVEGAEDVIYNSLQWVNLMPDEGPREGGALGPYRQSKRLALYKKYAEELIEKGHAYPCFCTKDRLDQMRQEQEKEHQASMYDRLCQTLSDEQIKQNLEKNMPYAVRMKIPKDQQIVVHDEIVGDVTFDSKQIDDTVILKSDGFPTYHLAVVVDDYLMQITHVFRGTEWLSSAPKHVLLYKYFGWESVMPKLIHIPVLLNKEGGGKLSKRFAHTSVDYYKQEGFLPQAVVNYLANIVWNHPEGKEIFTLSDFGKAFDLDPFTIAIKANGVKFDLQKLLWVNGVYIRDVLTLHELIHALYAFDKSLEEIDQNIFRLLVEIAKTRIKTLKEFKEMIDPFMHPKHFDRSEEQKNILSQIQTDLEKIKTWDKAAIAEILLDKYIRQNIISFKQLYQALINTDKGLPLTETFEAIGKENTLALFRNHE